MQGIDVRADDVQTPMNEIATMVAISLHIQNLFLIIFRKTKNYIF